MNTALLGQERRGLPRSSLTHGERVLPRPILVVDSDTEARRRVGECLARLGVLNPRVELNDCVEMAADLRLRLGLGAEALPVLVIVDPGSSHTDALPWMRETLGLGGIPIIVLTADDQASSVKRAYDFGVRSYLIKPVGFVALASVVRELGLPWMLT